MRVDLKREGVEGPFYTFDYPKSDTETDDRVNQSFLRGHRPMLLNGWFYVPSVGTEPDPVTARLSVRSASVWDLVVWVFYRAKHFCLGYEGRHG